MTEEKPAERPLLTLIDGGKMVLPVEIPEVHEFKCFKCGASCVMYPRAKPMAVQHALPVCSEWKRGEKDGKLTRRFLVTCGLELLIPGDADAD
jgi:hypothetical protein